MVSIIHTIKQNCRRCYSCVRDCPTKALRIIDGQAFVVTERCIACGNCTVVCSQKAKAYLSGLDYTTRLLESGKPVAALLAPSFPADFPDIEAEQLVGALHQLGFELVIEVAVGADLVSQAYQKYLEEHPQGIQIATACPAVVEYIRKYNPELTDCLVPLVSPMIATALAARAYYGPELECVFIGPCVAKKAEARDMTVPPVVAEVLTFQELYQLFEQRRVVPKHVAAQSFDPPFAGLGRVYPMVGGMLKSAGIERDPLNAEVIVLSGSDEVLDVLSNLRKDEAGALVIEAMMCRGCFSGPGMQVPDQRLSRKRRVANYVANALKRPQRQSASIPPAPTLSEKALLRRFRPDDQRLKEPTEAEIKQILAHTNKFAPEDELNCGACGYPTCRAKAVAVYRGIAEEAMCLPFMIEQAERVCHELKVPWHELREIHRHLINAEKLASMGQMAAGVAHELNNPLGTILLYTHILERKLKDRDDLKHDINLLVTEAQRCKKIIGSLLDFARQNRIQLEPVKIKDLVDHALNESMYAAQLAGKDIHLSSEIDPKLMADMDRDQMTQVLINLIKNGLEAMESKGGELSIFAQELAEQGRIRIGIQDQGCGIASEARDRVFQPFFTTKGIGKGTGLGLPISYGIVKMHRGTIWFDSETGKGTTFYIELPKTQAMRGRSYPYE